MIHRRTDGALSGLHTDFDPVILQSITLYFELEEAHTIIDRQLCPGARASFATERMIGRERLFLTVPPASLPLYVTHR